MQISGHVPDLAEQPRDLLQIVELMVVRVGEGRLQQIHLIVVGLQQHGYVDR